MMIKKDDFKNKSMLEKVLGSHKLLWTVLKESPIDKSNKCIEKDFIKEDKTKSSTLHLRIIILTLWLVKWESKNKLSFQFLKKLNTIKKLKIKNSEFK